MTTTTSAPTSVETLQQSATRRSYVFLFVPTLFLFIFTTLGESDKWLHALDDEIIVAITVGVFLYFLVTRKISTGPELVRINRAGMIASALVVVAGLLAIALEFSDPNDIGDDPITLIAGILAVINGLLVMVATGPRSPDEAVSYGVEWARVRTTFWFSSLFLANFVFFALPPPYPSFSAGNLPAYAELAVLVILGVAGLWALVRSRREANPGTLRTYNNTLVVLAVILTALAFLQFDMGTVALSVMLIANRFL